MRICPVCKKEFVPGAWNTKYCNTKCARFYYKNWNAEWRGTELNGFSKGTIGAIAELVVSVDLMKKSFEVYRALSQSSSCDILALKNGKMYDFEVRSGMCNKSGSFSYPKKSIRGHYIAVYLRKTNEIKYIPPIS